MNKVTENSKQVQRPVDRLVSCIADIERVFTSTCGKTPSNGRSFVNIENDMCATIYMRKVRVFFNRAEGFEDKECLPCFFTDTIVFDS